MAITGDWDRQISRRTLLKTGGSFAAGITLAGLASDRAMAQASFGSDPFTLGVASGDPTPEGFVLWTRLAPDPLVVGGGLSAEPYEVRYEVARDEGFRHIHRHGTTVALPDEAHSVRVELDDLPPEREWYYRFKAGDAISPVGRTRTTPPGNSSLGALALAFVSCQNYAEGYFTPYADVAAADIDAVIHLGDYIYEGGARIVRAHAPAREIRTLDEYRIRHGQYKTDPDLQAAHAAHPWLVTWDDHELENGYAGLELEPAVPIEVARARRAAAYRAYWEHMPLARARKPAGPDMQLYRRFHWGKLVTFNVLDGRQYRSDQAAPCPDAQRDSSGYCPANLAADRTMLGAEQLEWLRESLATTKTRWNVLAQQTPFAPFNRPLGARAAVHRNRHLGRLRRRAPADPRLAGRAADTEPDRAHRRRASEPGQQRPARLPDARGRPGGGRTAGDLDLQQRQRGSEYAVLRRPREPARRLPEQQPGLRPLHRDAGRVDERVPRREHCHVSARGRVDRRHADGRERWRRPVRPERPVRGARPP